MEKLSTYFHFILLMNICLIWVAGLSGTSDIESNSPVESARLSFNMEAVNPANIFHFAKDGRTTDKQVAVPDAEEKTRYRKHLNIDRSLFFTSFSQNATADELSSTSNVRKAIEQLIQSMFNTKPGSEFNRQGSGRQQPVRSIL